MFTYQDLDVHISKLCRCRWEPHPPSLEPLGLWRFNIANRRKAQRLVAASTMWGLSLCNSEATMWLQCVVISWSYLRRKSFLFWFKWSVTHCLTHCYFYLFLVSVFSVPKRWGWSFKQLSQSGCASFGPLHGKRWPSPNLLTKNAALDDGGRRLLGFQFQQNQQSRRDCAIV